MPSNRIPPAKGRSASSKHREARATKGGAHETAWVANEGPRQIMDAIKRGMPYREALVLQDQLGLDKEAFALLLRISTRTYERRRQGGKLEAQETDRALRLQRIILRAIQMYDGGEEDARAWLRQSLPALEGLTPLELIETEAGTVLVEGLIGRIEAGVFS